MQTKLSEKSKNDLRERRRDLLTRLGSDDVLMFNENGKREYFIVSSIGPTKKFVSGNFRYDSEDAPKRRISLDEIADRDPKVAYLQDILSQT